MRYKKGRLPVFHEATLDPFLSLNITNILAPPSSLLHAWPLFQSPLLRSSLHEI